MQPCSYNTRDISFEVSWPSPIHPTTMCLPQDSILGIGIKLRYRPHLNENGRVHFAAQSILLSLGTRILCGSYSRYVITEDFNLVDCASYTRPEAPLLTLSSNTDTPPTTTGAVGQTPQTTLFVSEVTPSSVLLSSSAAVAPLSTNPIQIANKPSPQPVTQVASSANMDSSSSQPSNTLPLPPNAPDSPEIPTERNKNGSSIDYLMVVLISLLVVSLLLLFLFLLAALVLCARRRKTRKSQCANLSTRYTIGSLSQWSTLTLVVLISQIEIELNEPSVATMLSHCGSKVWPPYRPRNGKDNKRLTRQLITTGALFR